jgi:hypothetical protein
MSEYHCEHPLDADELERYVDLKCACKEKTPWLQHFLPENLVPTKGPGSRTSQCIICLDEIEDHALTIEHSQCKSCFHIDCFHEWFGYAHNCPLCKGEINRIKQTVMSALEMPEKREAEIRLKILQQNKQPSAYRVKMLKDAQIEFGKSMSVIHEIHWQKTIIAYFGEGTVPTYDTNELLQSYQSGKFEIVDDESLDNLWIIARFLGNIRWHLIQIPALDDVGVWVPDGELPEIVIKPSLRKLARDIGEEACKELLAPTSTLLRLPIHTKFLVDLLSYMHDWRHRRNPKKLPRSVLSAKIDWMGCHIAHWCLLRKPGDDIVYAVMWDRDLNNVLPLLLDHERIPGLLDRIDNSGISMEREFEETRLRRFLDTCIERQESGAKYMARDPDMRGACPTDAWNSSVLEPVTVAHWTDDFTGKIPPEKRPEPYVMWFWEFDRRDPTPEEFLEHQDMIDDVLDCDEYVDRGYLWRGRRKVKRMPSNYRRVWRNW